MTSHNERWAQAGARLKQIRLTIPGMTQPMVQSLDGPSTSVLRALENGRADDLKPMLRRSLERIYGLQPRCIDRFVAGEIDDLPAADEPVDVPGVTRVPTAQGEALRLLTSAASIDPRQLLILAVAVRKMSDAASDAEDDRSGAAVDQLIENTRRVEQAAEELLSAALGIERERIGTLTGGLTALIDQQIQDRFAGTAATK